MWLWRKESFEEPFATVHLTYVAKFGKGGNAFAHDGDFPGSVVDFPDTDRSGRACVNLAGVVLDWDELSLIVEDGPIFLNEVVYVGAERGVQMG